MLAPSARGQCNRHGRTKLHLSCTTRIFSKIVVYRVSGRGAVGDMSFRAIGLLAALVSTTILSPEFAFAASDEARFHSGNHRPVSVRLLTPSDSRLGAEYSYNRTVERVSSSEFGRIASITPQVNPPCLTALTFGAVAPTAIPPLAALPGALPLGPICFLPFTTPTKQTIATHKTALFYKPTSSVTLRVTGSYVRRTTTEESFSGFTKVTQFESVSEGWGDTAFEVIATPVSNETQQIDLSVGASAPTGRINARSKFRGFFGGFGTLILPVLVLGPIEYDGRPLLPAESQIGSGTTDILLGAAMRQHLGSLTVGGSWNSRIRTGHSANQYRLGDVTTGTVWSSYEWLDGLSTTLSLTAEHTGRLNLKSRDQQTFSKRIEEFNSGSTRVDAAVGVNLYRSTGSLAGTGVTIEYRRPLSQSNNGVQMERQSDISLRWSYFR